MVDSSKFFRDETATNELIIVVDGEDTVWKYRSLSWWERTECLSKAMSIGPSADGQSVTFALNVAAYYVECFMKMLVSAPIPITPASLKALTAEIGSALETIAPQPMGYAKKEVEEATKKESETS